MRGKKFLCGLLAAGFLFGGELSAALPSISVVAAAEEGLDGEEVIESRLNYEIKTDEETGDEYAEITGYEGSPKEIEIPAVIGELPVKSIGDGAFRHCYSLISVTIPVSVTSIGD